MINPAQISTTPVSIHAEVVRVSACRLPKKSSAHLSIRRKATWIKPPHFSKVSVQGASPPSLLDAPLSGAVTSSLPNVEIKPPHMLDDTVPTGWKFDIHEDTKDEEIGNLVIHSATTRDISSDTAGINAKADRGKENILPTDGIYAVDPKNNPASTGRNNRMTNRRRTPLGDLDIAEFFAEGCDVDSCFIIPAEMGEEQLVENADHWMNSENYGAEKEGVAE